LPKRVALTSVLGRFWRFRWCHLWCHFFCHKKIPATGDTGSGLFIC
jgi:hypothetical protein